MARGLVGFLGGRSVEAEGSGESRPSRIFFIVYTLLSSATSFYGLFDCLLSNTPLKELGI